MNREAASAAPPATRVHLVKYSRRIEATPRDAPANLGFDTCPRRKASTSWSGNSALRNRDRQRPAHPSHVDTRPPVRVGAAPLGLSEGHMKRSLIAAVHAIQQRYSALPCFLGTTSVTPRRRQPHPVMLEIAPVPLNSKG